MRAHCNNALRLGLAFHLDAAYLDQVQRPEFTLPHGSPVSPFTDSLARVITPSSMRLSAEGAAPSTLHK